jgi:chemotaxis-related protein WspB
MMFLLFHLGTERYALEAAHVVEVLPLVDLKLLPQAPSGVAGLFNYHGQPVPAVDLSELILHHPAPRNLSTRIIVVNHPDGSGHQRLVGLIVERATDMIKRNPQDFSGPALKPVGPPCFGPVLMDGDGVIQKVDETLVLPADVRDAVFCEAGNVIEA